VNAVRVLSVVVQSLRLEVLTALFVRIQKIWGVMLCHCMGCSVHFKGIVVPSLSEVKRSKKNAKNIIIILLFLDLITRANKGIMIV
jgi:hypothetical protein